jgi:hypothetical protein
LSTALSGPRGVGSSTDTPSTDNNSAVTAPLS